MLSICITIKNRSRVKVNGHELMLFPRCVDSIVQSIDPTIPCEIVVTDWESNDWPLAEWLEQAARPIPVQIITLQGDFSRGRGLNKAADAAKGDVLLFLDADVLLCPEVITRGLKYMQEGKAFFPVLYSFYGPEHQDGWWRHEGFGNCMMTKDMYGSSEKWPEYETWGKEDIHFLESLKTHGEVVREEIPGFYHQWHPEDIVWKNCYSARAQDIAQEVQQIRVATQELMDIVPPDEILILADESRFGSDPIPNRHTIPFTEQDGEYAGPPLDDARAIAEFERLRGRGAAFMAFAWMAFWWLDYYGHFLKHIQLNYPCIIENDRLVVFDLRHEAKKSLKGGG